MKESTKRIRRDCEAICRTYYTDRRGCDVMAEGIEEVIHYGDIYLKPLLLLHEEAETKVAHDIISVYVQDMLDSICERMEKCKGADNE